MSSSQRGNTKYMYIVFYGLFSRFLWGLEQWTNIYIKTNISIACSYYFGASIMAVLSHFSNHNTWSPTILFGKSICHLLGFAKRFIVFYFFTIHTRKGFNLCFIAAKNNF